MCTVTCLIRSNEIILTSNRDIPIKRPHSKPPKMYNFNSKNILFPLDPIGKGSWVGTNDTEIVCLLNHKGEEKGIESRGLLLRKILTHEIKLNDLESISKKYNPYKLIYLNNYEKKFYEITWNTKKLNLDKITDSLKIWSSNSIYNIDKIKKKADYFSANCNINCSSKDLLKFHLDSKNLLKDNFSETTSITQIIHSDFISMHYKDLINQKDYDTIY